LIQSSLAEFFSSVVVSIALRNGDAHLKNFGLLYTDPTSHDCRISPTYDLVCTTVYLPRDQLALKLAKSKSWPDRETLIDFGQKVCGVERSKDVLDRISMSSRNTNRKATNQAFGSRCVLNLTLPFSL
jgi:serine/threonine-protein kinase HipA